MPDLGTMPGSVSPKKENQNLEVCFKGSGRTLFFFPPQVEFLLLETSVVLDHSLYSDCAKI